MRAELELLKSYVRRGRLSAGMRIIAKAIVALAEDLYDKPPPGVHEWIVKSFTLFDHDDMPRTVNLVRYSRLSSDSCWFGGPASDGPEEQVLLEELRLPDGQQVEPEGIGYFRVPASGEELFSAPRAMRPPDV